MSEIDEIRRRSQHRNEEYDSKHIPDQTERDVDYLLERIAELEAEVERECEWTCGAVTSWDAEEWYGDCGAVWTFIEDGPVENEMIHCPKCGGKVRVKEEGEWE